MAQISKANSITVPKADPQFASRLRSRFLPMGLRGQLAPHPGVDALQGGRARRLRDGFTMLELMVVIAVILVLVAMAAGSYQRSLIRSREAVLKQDLATMRNAIDQYTLDKSQGPQSLDDLVSAGYLRQVPTDPITRQRTWHANYEDVLLSPDQSSSGVTDVHSTSDAISPFESTPYSSW